MIDFINDVEQQYEAFCKVAEEYGFLDVNAAKSGFRCSVKKPEFNAGWIAFTGAISTMKNHILEKQAEIDELKAKVEKTCKWSHDEDLNWWTQCGNGFVFGDDPHPAKHNFKHCCFCGGLIEAAQGEGHDNIK